MIRVLIQRQGQNNGGQNNGCGCPRVKKKPKSVLPGVEKDEVSNQLEERFKEHTYALSVKPRNENGLPIAVKL